MPLAQILKRETGNPRHVLLGRMPQQSVFAEVRANGSGSPYNTFVARRLSPVTFEVVRKVAAALPAVEEGTAWGVPVLKLHGRLLACMASNKSAEPNTLVVRLGFDQRDAMIADDPETYYLKPHYEAYACVLVRQSRISRDALTDLLQAGWRFVDASAQPRRPSAKRNKRA